MIDYLIITVTEPPNPLCICISDEGTYKQLFPFQYVSSGNYHATRSPCKKYIFFYRNYMDVLRLWKKIYLHQNEASVQESDVSRLSMNENDIKERRIL